MVENNFQGPTFLIAGMQKGGTSALWQQLGAHPDIFFPAKKELHFFDKETLDWDCPDYAAYERLFAACPPGSIAGEATPIYTYWPGALERIAAYRPAMKLIVILRNPAMRAYSHWAMELRRDAEWLDFAEAIRVRLDRPEAVQGMKAGAHRVFSYVERGFYAEQIERMFRLFPREQVLVTTHDAFRAACGEVLDRIVAFLGLDPFAAYPPNAEFMVAGQREKNPPMPPDCRARLVDLFADDIRRTQDLAGLDLSGWLETGS